MLEQMIPACFYCSMLSCYDHKLDQSPPLAHNILAVDCKHRDSVATDNYTGDTAYSTLCLP